MSIWLLYDDPDYAVNQGFARMMRERGEERGMVIEPVLLSEITLCMGQQGNPFCKRNGQIEKPQAILSRQRDALISEHFERMGVPVFNNSRVCTICNDKRKTHQFLQGLPMPDSIFLSPYQHTPPQGTQFPVILKPACSHGGDRVSLVASEEEWLEIIQKISPEPALQQAVVSDAGQDLRVYILGEKILAGVMRTARDGVVSNFKKGGQVELHELTEEERSLANQVIQRFQQAGAPLIMAGVDMLYENGHPLIGEIEDVVGSRMLYQTSDIDIVALYLDEISLLLQQRMTNTF